MAALSARHKMMFGTGIAALIALVVALSMWGSEGSYKVLFTNLSDKDGGAVIAQLSQMNIPYRHADGGSAILVPAEKVHDVRLKLASAGLPKGGIVGFELMDNARFGQTQFQERLTFQRGLEGELTRSISALAAVQAARVHLALPNQNGFFREQQKPSASVLLTLHPGRTLDRSQIAGIVHLVSSSVPELNPKAVSVLDASGSLLSGAEDNSAGAGLDAQQLQYVAQMETGYQRRILDILEPMVGRDNLRAQVTAEVDFTQTEATSEEFKPNNGDNPAAVRSRQQNESNGSNSATPSGVPGATSNQPPVAATAPIAGASAPLQTANAGNGSAIGANGRRDSVTNYEVDKTVRVTRNASGLVRRLNAAVVVNHRGSVDPKGKPVTTPLTDAELKQIETLVRETIGFSQERGDSVKVINAPFKVDATPKEEALPMWQQREVQDLLRIGAVPAALALVALVVIFVLIRPVVRAALAPPVVVEPETRGQKLNAVVDEVNELPNPSAPLVLGTTQSSDALATARKMAKENPAAVAGIVRSWVNGEEAV